MRIISGKLKGNFFLLKYNNKYSYIRPTTNYAKEGLFNILNNNLFFNKIKVLDLFCGIGGISYEFISRGVANVDCVDINYNCIKFIKKTTKKFNIKNNIQIFHCNVFNFLKKNHGPYDLIFADPPYNISYEKINIIIELINNFKWITPQGILILEHCNNVFKFFNKKKYSFTKKYGYTRFSFFKN